MKNINLIVDESKIIGEIKVMHAVNNAPSFENEALLGSMQDAGIPYSRLHDSAFIIPGRFVDVPMVFPHFDLDENDPNNYDFAFTDVYLSNLVKHGIKPFYRLGTSIENYSSIKRYFIDPPKDPLKWAKICEHIIMHYNEGWANGFHFDIEYWEIWNEPDNFPDIQDNQMWYGTKEQYFELYQVSASYLKSKFPKLKIGGYASCGFYAIAAREANPNAKVSPRVDYFIDFFKSFLEYITNEEHRAPLDFFSWHSYSGVKDNILYSNYCRSVLDEYGFSSTEHILNEWNPGIQNRGTLKDASDIASNMLALQNTSLSMLMYYDLRRNTSYCGLYNPLKTPLVDFFGIKECLFKAYYVFYAWNELYKLKQQVFVSNTPDDVYAVSSYCNGTGCLMITNSSNEPCSTTLENKQVKKALLLSNDKDLEEIPPQNSYVLKEHETLLLYY